MAKIELTESGIIILGTLQKPIHGYEIMKTVDQFFEGIVRIGPATLYTTLKKLEQAGLCTYKKVQNKKIYNITEEGLEVMKQHREKQKRVVDFLSSVE